MNYIGLGSSCRTYILSSGMWWNVCLWNLCSNGTWHVNLGFLSKWDVMYINGTSVGVWWDMSFCGISVRMGYDDMYINGTSVGVWCDMSFWGISVRMGHDDMYISGTSVGVWCDMSFCGISVRMGYDDMCIISRMAVVIFSNWCNTFTCWQLVWVFVLCAVFLGT
jgi:hypothetical protein